MNTLSSSYHPLTVARWMVIVMLVAVMFSPPVVNLLQLLLVLVVVSSSALRSRVAQVCRQPMVIGALAFYAVISIGVLYSIASQSEAVSMWSGWRKLLLLPLAMALFDEPRWKLKFVQVFVGAAAVCALASYYGWLTNTPFPVPDPLPGVVVRNHATQGMLFAVAALAAAVLAFRPACGKRERWLLAGAALLLTLNAALVTTGRSGYLALVVCGLVLVAGRLFIGRKVTLKAILVAVAAVGLMAVFLATSPIARKGITQAVDEMQSYQQAQEVTSMGIRMHFWKNTIALIAERPVSGYGTGAFGEAYRRQVSGQEGVGATLSGDPHNQFMKIAAEHGLIGLAVFLAFLTTALMQRPSAPYRLLGLGVLAAWCATSMANSHFSTFAEGVFIYLWAGSMLANARETTV